MNMSSGYLAVRSVCSISFYTCMRHVLAVTWVTSTQLSAASHHQVVLFPGRAISIRAISRADRKKRWSNPKFHFYHFKRKFAISTWSICIQYCVLHTPGTLLTVTRCDHDSQPWPLKHPTTWRMVLRCSFITTTPYQYWCGRSHSLQCDAARRDATRHFSHELILNIKLNAFVCFPCRSGWLSVESYFGPPRIYPQNAWHCHMSAQLHRQCQFNYGTGEWPIWL